MSQPKVIFQTNDDSSFKIQFTDNDRYLNDGTVILPKNSLGYVVDESKLITLIKPCGDPYISFKITDTQFADLTAFEKWFADNAVGTGVDPEQLAGFIASAEYVSSSSTIDFKNENGDVISTINAAPFIQDGMLDSVEVVGTNLVFTFNVASEKQPISIPLTSFFDGSRYYDKTATDALLATKADVSAVTASINELSAATDTKLATKQDTLVSGTNIKTVNNETLLGSGNLNLATTSAVTQAQYDAAAQGGTLDPDMLYIITDASAIDIQNYMTSAQTVSAITEAVSGKADSALVNALSTQVLTKVNLSTYNTYTANTNTTLNGKADTSAVTASINELSAATDTKLAEKANISDLEDTELTLAQAINVVDGKVNGKADTSAVTVDEYTIYATRDNNIYNTTTSVPITWLKFTPSATSTSGNFQFSGITGRLYLQNIDYVNGTYTVDSGSLDTSLVSGLSITFDGGSMIVEVDGSNPITYASVANTVIEYVKEVIPEKVASDAIYDNVYPLIKKVNNSLTALTVTSASTVQNQLSMRLNKNDGTSSSQIVNLDGYLTYSGTTLKAEAYVNTGAETLTTVAPTINSTSRTDYYFTDNVGQTADANHMEIQILTSDTINLAFYGYDNTGRLTSRGLVVSGGTVTSGYMWPSEATYSFSDGVLTVDYAYTGTSANNPLTINRILATTNYGSTASVSDIVGYVKALLKDKVEVTEYIENTLKPTIANLIARIEALENPS